MKLGDLVQVKTPLPEFGKIGIVVGPDVKWNLNPRWRVMFSDGGEGVSLHKPEDR